MTDRELLLDAAKAAGIEGKYIENRRLCFGGDWEEYTGIETEFYYWNPLTDDGDALRLAVKLGFSLKHYYYEGDYFIKVPVNGVAMTEPLAPDPYAATRRAIVRAAAAIGKELP